MCVSHFVSLQDATKANAILFVMSTATPHKIMLHILSNNNPITSSEILDTDDLLSALPETIFTERIIPQSERSDEYGYAGHIEQIYPTNATLTLS